MDRAYSMFELKSIDEETRTFEGIATTPSTDRAEDIVEPMGGVFSLPLPMLWQHGKGSITDPVGWITQAKPTPKGIPITGKMAIPAADYPQGLRDDLNKAWVMVRDKLVRGLSIGFRPIEWEHIKDSYGIRYTKWDFFELSPVTIPCNADCTIQTIKSIDTEQRAASGQTLRKSVRLEKTPGASGSNGAEKRKSVQLIPRNTK